MPRDSYPSKALRTVRIGAALLVITGLAALVPAVASAQSALPSAAEPPNPNAYDCIVKPNLQVDLSSPVSGVIDRIRADRGTLVKAGDVVAELVSDVEQANLALASRRAESEEKIAAAKLRIAFLKRRVERNQKLNDSKIVSDDIIDEIRTELRIAEQDLNTAINDKAIAALERQQSETILAQKVIRSPVDGIVTKLLLQSGEFTSEQTPIATIAAIDPLHVEAFLPVRLHGAIRTGMDAQIRTEAPADGVFVARVDIVDRVYDAASGTFGVRLILPNPDLAIPAGTRCELEFLQN